METAVTTRLFLWALPAAALAHIFEEFVYPGGFTAWYARYRPETALSFTRGFAVGINITLVAGCAAPLVSRPPQSVALWLTLAALVAGNALFHVRGVYELRSYSPGVITSILFYLPLAAAGYAHFLQSGEASPGTALVALALGGSYNFISAWRHRWLARRRSGA
jgi:uncharacterized protein with HXXEE motif